MADHAPGRRMARLPVDPRLARVLIEAARLGCLRECLVITAFLSIQDPRERPAGRLEAADERHASFADPRSDFVTVLNLWQALSEQSAAGSRALRRWCRENFLSWPRTREWQDLHAQLTAIARSGRRTAAAAASHSALHRALLAGFLGGIGVRDQDRTYLGTRDTRFVIAPGTPLARRGPHWTASLVETHRVYARMVAQIQPSWIEAAATHLVRRTYGDAEWSVERGMVLARETVSLYGRVLHSGRMVDFARIDPRPHAGYSSRRRWCATAVDRAADSVHAMPRPSPRSRASRPGCVAATCWSARRQSSSSSWNASPRR
jgi:ATP-dependent helicase HrpA